MLSKVGGLSVPIVAGGGRAEEHKSWMEVCREGRCRQRKGPMRSSLKLAFYRRRGGGESNPQRQSHSLRQERMLPTGRCREFAAVARSPHLLQPLLYRAECVRCEKECGHTTTKWVIIICGVTIVDIIFGSRNSKTFEMCLTICSIECSSE